MVEKRTTNPIQSVTQKLNKIVPSSEGAFNPIIIMNIDPATHPVLSKIQTLEQSDLLHVINGTYIAKRFFGKSCSWFSQRINGHTVNGKAVKFSESEIETLRNAIDTIAIELQELADNLK